jgi:hypothetical protein
VACYSRALSTKQIEPPASIDRKKAIALQKDKSTKTHATAAATVMPIMNTSAVALEGISLARSLHVSSDAQDLLPVLVSAKG